ncbi:hypothetical protein BurJ1DRAFT_2210 [Burkholderiales bacterium JOSHI_001]|nr:hypothetical protein BurJ1DRAFT_2210 [Burkholderiales bacterium JOSHI_001]
MKFIDNRNDAWHPVVGEDGPIPTPDPRANALLTLEQWHAVRDHWPRDLKVGLLLDNTVDVATLASDLPRIGLVVLQFPKWVDGRAYSQAHTLRARLRYSAQLRATGDVVVDMMPLLTRTGFDAVVLRHDQKQSSAERALGFFAGHYQADVNQPQPAFARDVATELKAAEQQRQAQADGFAGQGI